MKRLLIGFTGFLLLMFSAVSCHFVKEEPLGDTVAAQVFEPVVAAKKKVVPCDSVAAIAHDSVDIFYVGDGSTKHLLQLVSYPSRRDTLLLGKAVHLRVRGNADFGHVIRVGFFHLSTGDSIVKTIDEIPQNIN